MSKEQIEAINSLIVNRRSSYPKEYNGRQIEDAVVMQLLENANWAPNHGKTEPWRFKLFKGDALLALARFQADLYKKSTDDALFTQNKYDRFIEKAKLTSHVIAICMQKDPKGRIPEIEEISAVACAVQNIYLSLTAYGLRGYWSTGGGTYSAEMHNYLGLDQTQRCLGFFFLGMSDLPFREGKRGSIESKLI